MTLKWKNYHTFSYLFCNNSTFVTGSVARSIGKSNWSAWCKYKPWNLGFYPTRAAAMQAVTSWVDPKKHPEFLQT